MRLRCNHAKTSAASWSLCQEPVPGAPQLCDLWALDVPGLPVQEGVCRAPCIACPMPTGQDPGVGSHTAPSPLLSGLSGPQGVTLWSGAPGGWQERGHSLALPSRPHPGWCHLKMSPVRSSGVHAPWSLTGHTCACHVFMLRSPSRGASCLSATWLLSVRFPSWEKGLRACGGLVPVCPPPPPTSLAPPSSHCQSHRLSTDRDSDTRERDEANELTLCNQNPPLTCHPNPTPS